MLRFTFAPSPDHKMCMACGELPTGPVPECGHPISRRGGLLSAVEIIDIRQFRASDFAPLIDAESRAWYEGLKWDYRASAQLIYGCLAEKRLAGFALVHGKQIKGYSFFVYERGKGLIGDLFVDSGTHTFEHAWLLLDHVIETVTATPGTVRVEAQLPHFTLDELAPRFRARGFEAYERRFMVRALEDQAAALGQHAGRDVLREFTLEPWERSHDRDAAVLLYESYRDHVDTLINDQYASLGGASRLIENITHLRGCGNQIPQGSLVAIHRPTRKLAAVLALTAVRPATAHIPQIAVATPFQGRGLGTALMTRALGQAAQQGHREVSLTVTSANRRAVRFYERLKFETFRTFGAYVWNHR